MPVFQLHHSNSFWKADIAQFWFSKMKLPLIPTSGWTLVMMAFALCDKVDLYGFSLPPSAGGVWVAERYHNIELEQNVYRSLHNKIVQVQLVKNRRWGSKKREKYQ
mmetsp:Transcript_31083/g.43069  ORF Transcript_31083/g.43069 Transcript_31083/m.43069 type:complete len:106 (-) Transcript_31083:77-394(-)